MPFLAGCKRACYEEFSLNQWWGLDDASPSAKRVCIDSAALLPRVCETRAGDAEPASAEQTWSAECAMAVDAACSSDAAPARHGASACSFSFPLAPPPCHALPFCGRRLLRWQARAEDEFAFHLDAAPAQPRAAAGAAPPAPDCADFSFGLDPVAAARSLEASFLIAAAAAPCSLQPPADMGHAARAQCLAAVDALLAAAEELRDEARYSDSGRGAGASCAVACGGCVGGALREALDDCLCCATASPA